MKIIIDAMGGDHAPQEIVTGALRSAEEFGVEMIATSPSVIYEIIMTDGTVLYLDNPSEFPERVKIKEIKEPYVKTSIFVPNNYVGNIMELCQSKRRTYLFIRELSIDR